MSTGPIEVAEEALQKLDNLEIVDQESQDKAEKSPRRLRLTDEERRKIWEEKQAQKPVLEEGVKGKVKWYSVRGKYGFIAREDGQSDVFVHQSAIAKSEIIRYFLRTLADDEEVEFDVVNGDKGPEAANVTGPAGADVQGSPHYHILIHRPGRSNRRSRPMGDKKRTAKTDEAAKSDDAAGDEDKKKKNPKRKSKPHRRNRKTEKKVDNENESAEVEDDQEKPARRRVSDDKEDAPKKEKNLQTKIESPKGSGDASLGALPAAEAAVH